MAGKTIKKLLSGKVLWEEIISEDEKQEQKILDNLENRFVERLSEEQKKTYFSLMEQQNLVICKTTDTQFFLGFKYGVRVGMECLEDTE